jgi:DNA replication and repair protein RecF
VSFTSLSLLKLSNFRNYTSKDFEFNTKITAISGKNGIGKTNILEAISLLNKGNGIKGAEFDEMINNSDVANEFVIYGGFENHPDIENIGTSYNKSEGKRIFNINHRSLASNSSSKLLPAFIWLTPQMDNLFCSSKTIRRKFLDKIVTDIDAGHNSRLNAYNHAVRERISLLNRFGNKENWVDIIERKIAELGTAIASARNETVNYLNRAILLGENNFAKSEIKIIGEAEEWVQNYKAIEVEEKFVQKLKENRPLDAKANRTFFGVHRSDLTAIYLGKNIEAKFCSTGEQKSILIAITFARVRLFSMLNLPMAILLLDEIVSHLDDQRRKELMQEIFKLDCQSFLTATNKEFFSELYHFDKVKTTFLELS